jgi:hypothetical protein
MDATKMPEVSGRALVVAIQAVQRQIEALEACIDAGEEDGLADRQALLPTAEDAGRERLTACESAFRMNGNLMEGVQRGCVDSRSFP